MIQAILFDLDDTLLGNDIDIFLPRYFGLLGQYTESLMPRKQFIEALLACTQLTIMNTDTAVSNYDVFWQAFTQRTGLDPKETERFLQTFYAEQFCQLQDVTHLRPESRPLVEWCLDHDYQVVIATNPLFPRSAIEQRLTWAGLPPSEFSFTLVTTMENMHATKPNPDYYREILRLIDATPATAIMIGDSWKNDILPTAEIGMANYWLPTKALPAPPDASCCTGYGSLADFYEKVKSGWLDIL